MIWIQVIVFNKDKNWTKNSMKIIVEAFDYYFFWSFVFHDTLKYKVLALQHLSQ